MKLFFHLWPNASQESAQWKKDAHRFVLLHGLGGTGALWRPIAASLENHSLVMALDQRGHGQSRPVHPDRFTPQEYGQDVIDTMEAENFQPAWLVGHSMGVRSACAAAHLKPEWVRGLVLIDLGFSGPAGGGLGEGLAHFLRVLPEKFASRDEARAFMSANCPDPSIAQYLMAVSVRDASGALTFPFDHPSLVRTIEAVRDISVRPWVKDLAAGGMPILVLRGAQSGVWSHEQFEQERKEFAGFPSVRFKEIEGAGHGLPFEQRARFLAELEAFCLPST
jgi:esterase